MTLASCRQRFGGGAAAGLLLVAIVAPAIAQSLPSGTRPDESNLDRHGYYTNSAGHKGASAREVIERDDPGRSPCPVSRW